jgi:hypothetical protein
MQMVFPWRLGGGQWVGPGASAALRQLGSGEEKLPSLGEQLLQAKGLNGSPPPDVVLLQLGVIITYSTTLAAPQLGQIVSSYDHRTRELSWIHSR